MSDKLYESDVFAWSAEQAELLRRLARGERVNGLDWENLIEEIQDVGISQRNAVESWLRQTLVHLLKICAWPTSESVEHWKEEASNFLADAAERYTPSMRQTLNIDRIFAKARRQVERIEMRGLPRLNLPDTCPLTLDDLLADDADVNALVARLKSAAPH